MRTALIQLSISVALILASRTLAADVDPFVAIEADDQVALGEYLSRGGDPNATDDRRSTLLTNAIFMRSASLVVLLLKGGAVIGSNDLFDASGQYVLVKELLDHGAKPDSPDGLRAVTAAIASKHWDVAALLLERGASAPVQKFESRGALNLAASNSQLRLVNALIAAGAPVDSMDLVGPAIAQASTLDIARALVNSGADVRADNGAALGNAVGKGLVEIVNLLLDRGADPSTASWRGYRLPPLVAATNSGNRSIVQRLLNFGADPNGVDTFGTAYTIGPTEDSIRFDSILSDFPRPHVSDGRVHTLTALIVSAREGYTDILGDLLAAGAAVDFVDENGNSALMHAALFGHVQSMRLLIEAQADVNKKNKIGMTALVIAATEGSSRAVKMLVDAGADRRTKFKGKTALRVATSTGNREAAAVIEKGTMPSRWHRDFDISELGKPPRKIRRELLESLVFDTQGLLLTQDVGAQPLGMEEPVLMELQNDTLVLANLIIPLVGRRTEIIERKMGIHLGDVRETQVLVTDEGRAGAFADRLADGRSRITITAKLIRANLIASIEAGFPEFSGRIASEQVEVLDELRRRVENLAPLNDLSVGSTDIGNATFALGATPLIEDYLRLVDLSRRTKPLETRYYGALMFMIAHELGHIALGHLEIAVPCTDREFAADRFASYLLGRSFLRLSFSPVPLVVAGLGSNTLFFFDGEVLSRYVGAAIFFADAYELARFPTAGGACRYPEAAERAAAIERILAEINTEDGTMIEEELSAKRDVTRLLGLNFASRFRALSLN